MPMARSMASARSPRFSWADGHAQVVDDGRPGEDAPSLGDVGEPEPADLVGRQAGDRPAVEVRPSPAAAARGPRRPGPGCSCRRRWLRARPATEPGGHLERDAEERLGRAVADVEVLDASSGSVMVALTSPQSGLRSLATDRLVSEVGGPHRRVARGSPSGVPDGDALAEVEHEDRVGRASTVATSCSTIKSETGSVALLDDPAKTRGEFSDSLDVEARQRLVEQEDVGLRGQGPPDLDEPADAQRAAPRPRPWPARVRSEQLEQPVDPLVSRRRARKQRPRVEHVAPEPPALETDPVGQDEVLAHREAQEELGLLEGPSQAPAAAPCGARGGDVARPASKTVPSSGTSSPDSTAKQRRLARAVGSDQADDAPAGDVEADVGERDRGPRSAR